MLYPNLQINIKKRGASGLDDSNAQMINTPVILDMAVQMSDEKNNFAFGHNNQPILNQFKLERPGDDKHLNHMSLQTPILELNHTPFFNQTSIAVSPSDSLNSFVAPNEILNTYTTTTSSTSTSTTSAYNDLNQANQMASLEHDLNHHSLNMTSKLLSASKQQQQIHQNNYLFTTTTPYTSSAQQISQYTSNLLNHHQTDLNDNLTSLNHPQMTAPQDQQQQTVQQQNLTYTELKPSNQQNHLIPNSVLDVTSYKKHQDNPPSYLSPPSPTNSLSSQTSSSNLDNQDCLYSYGESSTRSRSSRRYPGQTSAMSHSEKKSRMTKKQKYDAMINEEKSLLKNNEQLKNDIKELENMIVRYKQTIMNTVNNK